MRVCSACGRENPEDGRFCSFCARPLGSDSKGVSATPPQAIEYAKRRLRECIARGIRTDRRISPLWSAIAMLFVIPIVGLYGLSIASLFFSIGDGGNGSAWVFFYVYGRNLLMLAFAVLFAVLVFKMLERMNRHLEREEDLRKSMMLYLTASSKAGRSESVMMNDLIKASAYDGQALVYEKKLPARKWAHMFAVVFVVGAVGGIGEGMWMYEFEHDLDSFAVFALLSYVMYLVMLIGLVLLIMFASHLMKTMYTHDVRWEGFVNSTSVALRSLGKTVDRPIPHFTKDRSLLLYVVLTILTLGLFAIYWLYVLIDDPNKHLERQKETEAALLKAVEGA